MTNRNDKHTDILDTPIMPTGSGVADLEIARERDVLDGKLPADPDPGSDGSDSLAQP